MRTLYIICFVLTLGKVSQIQAQQLPFGSHYFLNPFMYNPAYTGSGEEMNVYLSHRSQFTGIAGSPQTSYLTLNGPINIKGVGLGLNAYSDVTSILSRNSITGNYSYSLKFGVGQSISFGLAAGIVDQTVNFQQAVVQDLNDPNLSNQRVRKTVFTADLGLVYKFDKLEVAFAMPQVLGNKIRFKENNGTSELYDMQQHFVGSLKYSFDVLPEQGIKAYPLVVMRGVKGAPFQYDISAVADWKKHGWFALTYRSNYAVGISAGVRYKNLSVGYSHDFTVTKIRTYTGATHEFMLSYAFGGEIRKQLDKHESDIKSLQEASLQQKEEITALQARLDSLEAANSSNSDKDKDGSMNVPAVDTSKNMAGNDGNSGNNGNAENSGNTENAENPGNPDASPTDETNGADKTNGTNSSDESNDINEMMKKEIKANEHVKTYKSTEFVDLEYNQIRNGYYVIIGAFNIKENAMAYREEVQKNKGTTTSVIYNKTTDVYEIYILFSEDYPTADNERKLWLDDFENAWVLNLE
jgi:type IX secretion system PorP/SprF family membrane protein